MYVLALAKWTKYIWLQRPARCVQRSPQFQDWVNHY